jgi:hypothetical protein
VQLGALSALKELDVGGNARIATFPNELCECLSDVDAAAHPLIGTPMQPQMQHAKGNDATVQRQRLHVA